MSIEFKNPPVKKGRSESQETLEIISALQSRPGDWALNKANASLGMATFWNRKQGIEAKSSTIDKAQGKCDIYARWVGEES